MRTQRWPSLLFPMFVLGAVVVAIVPIPSAALDVLLAAQLTGAVLILLTTVYTPRPLDFSVFPSLLLATTLGRLVLNIASTRLILTRGATEGANAAGGVIAAFGEFVAGGELIVGLVVFLILVIVQFVVITRGASRISEVAARFTLDALPGRQAAIDADVRSGLISQPQAAELRHELAEQADFYGAMDGASKFVRGDAIAGLVITAVNIAGGLALGVFRHGMPVHEAAATFTTLTIGDGLVSQLPALLISLAAALIATRSSTRTELPGQITRQLFQRGEVLFFAAAFLLLLAVTGLPVLPLSGLALACVLGGLSGRRRNGPSGHDKTAVAIDPSAAFREPRSADAPDAHRGVRSSSPNRFGAGPSGSENDRETLEKSLGVTPLEVRLGVNLLPLVDRKGGDLLHRVKTLRQAVAQELGFVFPKCKIRDDVGLPLNRYEFWIRGERVATGELRADAWMAIPRQGTTARLRGKASEPTGLGAAIWITPDDREVAEEAGYRVVPPATALLAHLEQVIRTHAAELLTRQHVHQLLEMLRRPAPRLVDELLEVMPAAEIQLVLCGLLRENVPIRDLERIAETLVTARSLHSVPQRIEMVRHALRRTICARLAGDGGVTVHPLAPTTEAALLDLFAYGHLDLETPLTLPRRDQLRQRLLEAIGELDTAPPRAVLCAEPLARAAVSHLLRDARERTPVISRAELVPDFPIRSHTPELTIPVHDLLQSVPTGRPVAPEAATAAARAWSAAEPSDGAAPRHSASTTDGRRHASAGPGTVLLGARSNAHAWQKETT